MLTPPTISIWLHCSDSSSLVPALHPLHPRRLCNAKTLKRSPLLPPIKTSRTCHPFPSGRCGTASTHLGMESGGRLLTPPREVLVAELGVLHEAEDVGLQGVIRKIYKAPPQRL